MGGIHTHSSKARGDDDRPRLSLDSRYSCSIQVKNAISIPFFVFHRFLTTFSSSLSSSAIRHLKFYKNATIYLYPFDNIHTDRRYCDSSPRPEPEQGT
mmetsp:Transcript_12168/g.24919  ORF Transcript_12168/g.24919 Transcript_12168/m.24919 type:complete len:98 (+) Transcript_12168:420-713(+)